MNSIKAKIENVDENLSVLQGGLAKAHPKLKRELLRKIDQQLDIRLKHMKRLENINRKETELV